VNSAVLIYDLWQTVEFIEPSGNAWVSFSEIFSQNESEESHEHSKIKDVDTGYVITDEELVSLEIIVHDSGKSQEVLFVILKGYCIEWTVAENWIIEFASIFSQLALEEIAPLIEETILV
jgi:hypothetical protein